MTKNNSKFGISKKIPYWVLPISYLILITMLVLSLFILNIIPYERSISHTMMLYKDVNQYYGCNSAYGEVIVSDMTGIDIGNIVRISGKTSSGNIFLYDAYVKNLSI